MTDPGRRDGDGSLPSEWAVPDDPRELDEDLRVLRRERAAAQRRARFEATVGRRWRRYASPRLVFTLVLLGVVGLGVGLVVVAPIGIPTTSAARPLAAPTEPPGSVGGLLPPATVRVGDRPRPVREIRPAVLAVLPEPCRCGPALRVLAASTGQYALPLVLVTGADDVETRELLAAARAARSYPVVDATAALSTAYAARGLTAVLVRADGVVTTVERDLRPVATLDGALSELTR